MTDSPDWLPGASPSDIAHEREDRRPLYFLFASALVFVLVLGFIVYSQVFREGSQMAANPSASSAQSEGNDAGSGGEGSPGTTADGEDGSSKEASGEDSSNPAAPETDEIDQARAAVDTIAAGPECASADADASAFAQLTVAAVAADEWNAETQQAITGALAQIDAACPKAYSLDLQTKMTDVAAPPQLNSLVADHSWITPQRPAPANAVESTSFTTPAKNIRCNIRNDAVACSIYTYSYPSPGDCEGKTATYEVDATNEVSAGCNYSVTADNVLDYGTVVATNGYVCALNQEAVECWSELSGHGFKLRRAAEEIF